jgi:phosphohistidine phosphatase
MKKTLVLIRHAKSSWTEAGLTDRERPLNERGKRDAPFMARRMSYSGLKVDLIVSTPSNRALTTAKHYADALGVAHDAIRIEPTIYEADVRQLMDAVNALDDAYSNVLIFGHNPGFSYLIQYLNGSMLHMPTNGVAHLEIQATSWSHVGTGSATLVDFDYPKKHLPAL